MITHIVLFEPKVGLSHDDRIAFAQSVVDCLRAVPTIERCSVGRAVDVDAGYPRQMGETTYEFAAVLEFTGEQELRSYLNHPLHVRMGEMFWKCCERSIVSEVRSVDLGDASVVDSLAE